MISKYLTILPALAALLLAAGCSNDDMDGILDDRPVAAQVTAAISNGQTATRASITGTTASFTADDVIYVVADGAMYEYTKHSDGTWSATSPYYFQNTDGVSFQGWYADPTTAATVTAENRISVNTAGQETNESGWNQWDILTASAVTASAEAPTVEFTLTNAFKHIMSQATFKFTAGDGISDLTNLTGYTLSGLITVADFNTLTCELTAGNTTDDISQTVTGTSEKELECTPIILVPQAVPSDLTLEVTYNDVTYTTVLTLPDDAEALAEGTRYAFNVTIANTGLTIGSATIEIWTTTTEQAGAASLENYTYTTNADGTRSYTVYNKTGLEAWAEYVLDGNYATNCTLDADIILTSVESGSSNWTAIGDDSTPYTGTFDGNGKTITNLTISASSNFQGLIGVLDSEGEVKNLTLENVSVSSSGNDVGAVVGSNSGTVTACSITGNVDGNASIGGVAGSNSGSITASYSTSSVSGSTNTGGVVGTNTGTVTACYWTNSSSDDGAANSGIGNPESNDGAAYVDGTYITWATAAETMNGYLTDWQYNGDGTTNPPLTLVAQ